MMSPFFHYGQPSEGHPDTTQLAEKNSPSRYSFSLNVPQD
jgi:hypothetical protein